MTHKIKLIFLFLSISFLFLTCQDKKVDYQSLPAISKSGILAVVEIPAGTNRKVEFNTERSRFEIDTKDGKERIIDFLPYPGNYGFIPSTKMDKDKGGDGDAMDVLIIAERMETGDTISIIPIGTLLLEDSGEMDTKIIAIPSNDSKQVMQATDYQTFTVKYHSAKKIIENWFLNYKGVGSTKLIGWKNDRYAINEIEKWKVKHKD